MKFTMLILFIMCSNFQSLEINTIRMAYKEAALNKDKIKPFHQLLSKTTQYDAIEHLAYKAVSITLLAKQEKTIKEKKARFVKGIKLLEYAIATAPNNIELRFIRLSVQDNTPKLLKYKNNIVEDKIFILKELEHIKSLYLKDYIKDYIYQSKVFTDNEKKIISEF